MKNYGLLSFLTGMLFITSCSYFQKPEPCIDGPTEVTQNSTATYNWCGTSVDRVHWEGWFGTSGDGESITITFTNVSNEFGLTVTGKSKFGKEASKEIMITVKP
jgi:hypothetical protein